MNRSAIPFLRVRHLQVSFPGAAHPALRDVSFTLERGKTLGIIGESGSGKSLTGLSLLGMLPPRAAMSPETELGFMGRNLRSLTFSQWRALRGRGIGAVFQEPMSSLNPLMRVGDQVLESVTRNGGDAGAMTKRDALARTEELFEEVGLSFSQSALRAYPHEYSGGMQQRVMIAMALAGNPSLLIADEPTSALDVTVQNQILRVLKEARDRRNMAMIFISHDLDIVASLADEVLVMRRGVCEESGPASKIFSAPAAGYTRFLLQNRLSAALSPILKADSLRTPGPAREASLAPVVLRLRDVSVGYGGGMLSPSRTVLCGVTLDLRQGECLGVVGESGSGKSSLAKTVVGMAKLLEGDIELFGENTRGMRPAARRSLGKRCQIIFQNTYTALNPRLTVKTILAEPLQVHGLSCPPERIRTMLEEVGLEEKHAEAYPHQLSGGQRQRVNIARALSLDPEILLCDEIVSALDVSVQSQILLLLREIRKQRGMSLVFISHDLRVVRHMADTVLVLKSGEAVEYGPVESLWARPETPYARLLLASTPGALAPEQELYKAGNF